MLDYTAHMATARARGARVPVIVMAASAGGIPVTPPQKRA